MFIGSKKCSFCSSQLKNLGLNIIKVNLFGNPIESSYTFIYDADIIAFQFVG